MEDTGRHDFGATLLDDLKLILKDVEDLLRGTGSQARENYQLARTLFESTLGSTRTGLSDAEQILTETTREAIETADAYVRENPWQAVGIGAAAGLVIGLMISRR